MHKDLMRQYYRKIRAAIPLQQKNYFSNLACQNFTNLELFKNCKNLAAYWPLSHEINTIPIIKMAQMQHKQCYLPAIEHKKAQQLIFIPYNLSQDLIYNNLNFQQPNCTELDQLNQQYNNLSKLDIIILPLVAFDKMGNRIGMGGAYYDRTLAKICDLEHPPTLIGLAYSVQQVDEIKPDPWDIKLDMVVTEKTSISCKE